MKTGTEKDNTMNQSQNQKNKTNPMDHSTGHSTGHSPENVTRDPDSGRFEPISEHKSGDKTKHPEPAKSR